MDTSIDIANELKNLSTVLEQKEYDRLDLLIRQRLAALNVMHCRNDKNKIADSHSLEYGIAVNKYNDALDELLVIMLE